MVRNEGVLNFTLQEGADLVGIVRVGDLRKAHPWRPPQGILPTAKSVIIFALKHSDAALDSPLMRISIADTLTIYHELSRIGYRLSRFLEKSGSLAATVHPAYPVEMTAETRGLVGDFSLRHAAASAGLGFIGKNNLLVTSEFGPGVRLAAVITDANLESTGQPIEKNCGACAICVERCPAKAISSEGVDLRRCVKVVGGPAGLNALTRFLLDLVDKPKEEMKKLIRSPAVWNFHQALLVGAFYDCHACMSCCPFGPPGKRRNISKAEPQIKSFMNE